MSLPIFVQPRGTKVGVSVGVTSSVGVTAGTTGPRGPIGPRGPQGLMGTVNVVEMTMEEFQALPVKDPLTIYVIIVVPP